MTKVGGEGSGVCASLDRPRRTVAERFKTLAELQTASDRRVLESAERLRCPLTGQSVAESWHLERPARPLDGYAALVERAGRRG